MKLIATYDFLWGPRSNKEIIRRGDEFEPQGTGIMNREEHARSIMRQGAGMKPEEWAKRKPKSDDAYEWAKGEVARLNAVRDAKRAAPQP